MATKKADKAPGKKNGGEQHDETAVTGKGRVHTIAKPRRNPVTRKIAEPSNEAPAQTSERMRELEAEGVIGPIPNTEPEDHAPIAPVPPKRRTKNAPSSSTPDTAPDDAPEIVVFAFRLTRAERDEIHAATGSAKASKFIRTLALAGARGDMKAVQEAVDEIHANRR